MRSAAAHGLGAAMALLLIACPDEPCSGGACSDAGPAEDAALDAEPAADAAPFPDAAAPDAEEAMDRAPVPDSGVRFTEVSCAPCNGGCSAALCLSTRTESFCADRCDDAPTACAFGFTCLDIDPDATATEYFCVSPTASCTTPGTGFGGSCYGDGSSCLMSVSECQGDRYALGYCTVPCADDSVCPAGWGCRAGDDFDVCQPLHPAPSERCAREPASGEVACEIDADCPSGACVRSEQSLPGVCAEACAGGCSSGACVMTARGARCLSDPCACHAQPDTGGARDLLAEALEAVGTTRCGLSFSTFDFAQVPSDIAHDPFRLSFYDEVHNEPLRAPGFGTALVRDLDGAAQGVSAPKAAALLVERMAQLIDRPAVRHAPAQPDPSQPLARAVAALIRDTGGVPDEAALIADAADVAPALQLALAEVVDAVRRAALARRTAIDLRFPSAVSPFYDYGPAFVARRADGFGLSTTNPANRNLLDTGFGYGDMYGAAVDVLEAVDLADLGRFAGTPSSTVATADATLIFAADTPIGRIALGDEESGIYDQRVSGFEGPWALLVDLGGNDVYRTPVAGNVSAENSASVMIDLAGDDQYGYVERPDPLDGARLPSDGDPRAMPAATPMEGDGPVSLSQTPRQGGARLGTAVLVDLGPGRDRYRSLRLSQGSGVLGAGVLVDEGGDDDYQAEAVAQGAGAFGIGLLYDGGGRDQHRAYTMAQGFGFARAAGLAFDAAGDDQWLMDPGDPAVGGDPLYFNGQRPGLANTTLGQGYGFGRRADATDRVFMSGGVGLLIDRSGSDQYQGSVFAQGGGFWFGTGILADLSGDDHYDSMWYGMGNGAHYSLGMLFEAGGDDVYGGALPRVNVTIAGGHDYTAAFLIDEAGNDIYHGSRLTIGAGNANGMGFFADNGGDDQYEANSLYSVGAGGLLGAELAFVGSPRRLVDSVGVFIDAAGHDTYMRAGTGPAELGDDRAWVQTQNPDPEINQSERGTAVDGQGDSTLHCRF